ncbi:MAG TPA: metallophosphoesterase [Rhizobacter sp.]|nr:metallophosphoesterase [Rhizobacter sp.]
MKLPVVSLLACSLLAASMSIAHADEDRDSDRPLTLAVFGDWPYNQNLLTNAPLLTKSVNADRQVDLVLHVGDIHSGSMPCTSAGILPPIPTSNPGWNQRIYYQFQQFNAPLVYTPGDNEWTDCHKSKEFSAGDPLKELASVRSLFFAKPGRSLGGTEKRLLSQAEHVDPAHPADAQFVENLIWDDAHVVFVTVNLPGSNNDTLPWTGNFIDQAEQAKEVAERTDADIRWLQAAFDRAEATHAKALVIGLQADMWDPAAAAPGGDGLFAYTGFVRKLADLSLRFRKPVLLLNGDSHVYGADRPLADPGSASGKIHGTFAVPNLTRITVQGSTNAPAEWLRLTIDPRSPNVFSWQNIAYCTNPLGSCQ